MKKSDLKDGMIVEYRNGLRRLVLGDRLLGKQGNANIEEYGEDLKNKHFYGESAIDIVKVYTIESSLCVSIESIFLNGSLNLIWERDKEIDWSKVPFGTKVITSDCSDFEGALENEYIFVGYKEDLKRYPFIVALNLDKGATSFRYCKIHPLVKIQEEWYKE